MSNQNTNTDERTALVVIDIQNDYFPGGACELEGVEAAADKAVRVIGAYRELGLPVIHIQHLMQPERGYPFFLEGTPGQEIHPKVAPAPGEPIVVKNYPSSFQGTNLESLLRELKVERVVIVGNMTQACVCSTGHSAFERGFAVTVVGDATATRALQLGDEIVPAEQIHRANLASLDGLFAHVTTTDRYLKELAGSLSAGAQISQVEVLTALSRGS